MRAISPGHSLAFTATVEALFRLVSRISISRWMLIVVGVTLAGYTVFGIEYYLIDRSYRDLLKANSTYIEFEDVIRSTSVSHRLASFAAAHAASMPADTVRTTAADFVDAARATAAANKVAALRNYFVPVLAGATTVEAALSGQVIDVAKLREGL